MSVAGRWPLVAREEDLAHIASVVVAGTANAVLVYGPPGVGKTRFAEECLDVAERAGWRVARVAASRAAAEIPLGALAHILLSGTGSDGDIGRLAERARQDLHALADGGRLLLFVDDLPALDPLSLLLLAQHAAAGSMLLLGTLRSGEPTPDELAALWSGDRVVRVDLTDLDRDGTDALLHEVLGGQVGLNALAEFWRASHGNPLYLRELMLCALRDGTLTETGRVWGLTGPLPSSPRLLELVAGRLRSAGPAGRAVLDRLALCQPLGLDELAADAHLDVLEELEAAGLIRVRVDRQRHEVTLTHPVHTQVLQDSVTHIRSRSILVDEANRIEGYGLRRRQDALRVAAWRLKATGTADPDLLLEACRLARHTPHHARQERLARGALAARDDVEARLFLGESLHALCRFEESEAVLAGAGGLPTTATLRQRLALAQAVTYAWGLARLDLAAEVLEKARRELPEEFRGELVALGALQLAVAERPVDALALLADNPLSPAGKQTRLRAIAEAHALLATGRTVAADAVLETMRRPWDVFDVEAQFMHAGSAHMAQSLLDYAVGRLPSAIAAMTRALQFAVEDDLPQSQVSYSWQLGRMHLAAGRPRTAARWARDGIAVARARGLTGLAWIAATCLATALAQLGDAEGSEAVVAEFDALPASAGMTAQARAWSAAARGDLGVGGRILLDAAQQASADERRSSCAELLHDAARLGEATRAVALMDQIAELCDSPLVALRAAHVRALVRRDPAALDEVAEGFAGLGMTLVAAEAATAASGLWRGRSESRRAMAATARANVLALGCEGARTPTLAAMERSVGPLTERETEICRLAARGVPSRDIAGQLFLSVRTVNNHLQNAYTKLGVGSRAELVDALSAR